MKIKQAILLPNAVNRPGLPNPCQYITVHNTGNYNKGATAAAHAVFLHNINKKISWHYTVDDKEIYQHLPDNETAFHAGDGTGDGNRKSLGVEICVNADGDLRAATERAERLIAYLCRLHNIPFANVVQHNQWNGKNCPQELRASSPYSWTEFIAHVQNEIAVLPSVWALDACEWAKEKGIIMGDGSDFKWFNAVTRQELAVILYRYYLCR